MLVLTDVQTNMLLITVCNNNTSHITDISTLQFIRRLRNFMHIISVESNPVPLPAGYEQDIRPHPVPAGFKK